MGRLTRTEFVQYSNYNFIPVLPVEELSDADREVEVYNTRTSFDFNWLLNKLCQVEGVGFFIIRRVAFDFTENIVIRGDKIKLFGRYVKTQENL